MTRAPDVLDTAFSPPRTDYHALIHQEVVEWLRREMAMPVEAIDYDASLFDLGINSMGAATIAGNLELSTRKRLNPEAVYELETINELAAYLARLPLLSADSVSAAAGLPGPSHGPVCCSPADTASGRSPLLDHYEQLNRRIRALKQHDRYFFEPELTGHDGAWVTLGGRRMLMLSSYEYLGLLGHARLAAMSQQAMERFGTGHHGARLLTGTTSVHLELERKLAAFMRADAAMLFSSGYVTNLSTIATLVGRGDCVLGDQWNHASIVDGCRMSGADFIEFRHNDMDSLKQGLESAAGKRTLVVVDAVFSMDGDIIDLPGVVALCRQHGALLMVDEAHSLGVLGRTGRGIQEHFQLDPGDVDIKMGTLSKTLAGSGGFVAATEPVITYLRHHARGYIFSGALPACQAAVSLSALEVLEQQPELIERLWASVARFRDGLLRLGFASTNSATPIIPVMTRNDETTLEMTRICRDEGLLVVPVCFPAVPIDAPRLRTCISTAHTHDEIDFALEVLARAGRATGLIA